MSEKKGLTVKLKYTFDTARNLEIYLPKLNNWYRVTAREFRSFTGKRRIQDKEYQGPIYLYETNTRANKKNIENDIIAGFKWKSKIRKGEYL